MHAREGYSSHFVSVCLSVCFFIVEKAPFSGLKLTSIHSRLKCFKCSTFLKIEAPVRGDWTECGDMSSKVQDSDLRRRGLGEVFAESGISLLL